MKKGGKTGIVAVFLGIEYWFWTFGLAIEGTQKDQIYCDCL